MSPLLRSCRFIKPHHSCPYFQSQHYFTCSRVVFFAAAPTDGEVSKLYGNKSRRHQISNILQRLSRMGVEIENSSGRGDSNHAKVVYRSGDSLSVQQWLEMAKLTGLTPSEMKALLWYYMESRVRRGSISAQKKKHVLEFLRQNEWRKLKREEMDALQKEVDLGRHQLHGLIQRLRSLHHSEKHTNTRKERKYKLRQLLKDRGYAVRHNFTTEEIEFLHKETGLSHLQIYVELRRFRDPPGEMTPEKRAQILDWYFAQVDRLLESPGAESKMTPAAGDLPPFPDQLRNTLQLSKEQVRHCISYLSKTELSPRQRDALLQSTEISQDLSRRIMAHPLAIERFLKRQSQGTKATPDAHQKELLHAWLTKHEFKKPTKEEYLALQHDTDLSAKQVYYLVSSMRKSR